MTDNSHACLSASEPAFTQFMSEEGAGGEGVRVRVDRVFADEEHFPFEIESFDAVVSNLSLHCINQLPLTLMQINAALKPDRPVLAATFGTDTLFELRTSLQLAELERLGGISPHVSPFTDSKDIGSLLTETEFKLTTSKYLKESM